jgi:hypothetical protein
MQDEYARALIFSKASLDRWLAVRREPPGVAVGRRHAEVQFVFNIV